MTGASPLRYVVITPVRDEARNLRSLADALAAQTERPQRWIIANNGSTDETMAAAEELAATHPWIEALDTDTHGALMRGAPIVRAFHAALEQIEEPPDVVVKLDADITFEPNHFERLLAAFASEPTLGIASGSCFERHDDGGWRQRHGTGPGVWGANRAYRWHCLDEILPLEERMGWDTLDLVKASVHGWQTKVIQELPFRHHRPEGVRDGSRLRKWASQGRAAHYMGYRLSYLLARTGFRVLREPAAVALLWGYASAALRGDPTCADPEVRAYIRRAQSWRRLPERAREALRPSAKLTSRSE